ncbi:unnamed protein product [Orchesella dallaii]|uniref:Gustatory receptor n=1 Tax=Orchesella dallaii TaxID=48710 RepID=A0ABP1QL08_9HEXA
MKFTGMQCKTAFVETRIQSKSRFLVTFFNLFSTTGFIPISVLEVKREFNGTFNYHFTTSILKKLISGFLHGAVLSTQFVLTITPWIYGYENISFIAITIQFLNNVFGLVYVAVAINLLWKQKEKLLNLLNCTRTTVQHGKLMNRLPVALLIVAFTYTTIMIYDHLNGSQLYFLPMRNASLVTLLKQSCILKMEDKDGGCSWWVWALYLLFKLKLIIISYSIAFFFFNHYFFLFLALTMLDLGKEFMQKLIQTDSIHKAVEIYLIMKTKVKIVNDCAGPLILCYYASHMSFLLKGPDILMGFGNVARSEKVKIAMENWFELNFLSASTPISSDYIALDARFKIMSVMNEVKSGSLAISCKYFAITNTFLSSIFCGIVHSVAVWVQLLWTIATALGFMSYENVSVIGTTIQFLNGIFGIIYVLVAIDLVWNRKDKLVNVLECTRTTIKHGRLVKATVENWLEKNLVYSLTPIPADFTSLENRMKLMTIMSEVKGGSLAVSCKYFAITNKFLRSVSACEC